MSQATAEQRSSEQVSDKNAICPFHVDVPEALRRQRRRCPDGCERLSRRTLSCSAEQAYPKLIHFNKLPRGGHFAAWEQPRLLSEEVRAGFSSLR
jgi:hypothetical protein